jgi:hypothetical protein
MKIPKDGNIFAKGISFLVLYIKYPSVYVIAQYESPIVVSETTCSHTRSGVQK